MEEAEIIERVLEAGIRLGGVVALGAGDDAAVLRVDGSIVLSTDVQVQDVHFRLDWLAPEEIGARAAAAALSDLAAMGAEATALLLTLVGRDGETVERVGRGASAFARSLSVPLIGGDISSGPLLAVDVVAVGRLPAGWHPWMRSGARDGDRLWVTGRLGGPRRALDALLDGTPVDPEIRTRFAAPMPRLAEAAALRGADFDVHAAIDVSDGLLLDAGRVARASELRLDLDAAAVPRMDRVGPSEALRSGEEYELLLALPEGSDPTAVLAPTGTEVACIGRFEAGEGVWLDGVRTPPSGFDHFGSRA